MSALLVGCVLSVLLYVVLGLVNLERDWHYHNGEETVVEFIRLYLIYAPIEETRFWSDDEPHLIAHVQRLRDDRNPRSYEIEATLGELRQLDKIYGLEAAKAREELNKALEELRAFPSRQALRIDNELVREILRPGIDELAAIKVDRNARFAELDRPAS